MYMYNLRNINKQFFSSLYILQMRFVQNLRESPFVQVLNKLFWGLTDMQVAHFRNLSCGRQIHVVIFGGRAIKYFLRRMIMENVYNVYIFSLFESSRGDISKQKILTFSFQWMTLFWHKCIPVYCFRNISSLNCMLNVPSQELM